MFLLTYLLTYIYLLFYVRLAIHPAVLLAFVFSSNMPTPLCFYEASFIISVFSLKLKCSAYKVDVILILTFFTILNQNILRWWGASSWKSTPIFVVYFPWLQANIHSIMGSEDQVLELMVLLDTGLNQANRIEEKLTEYERKLQVLW